MSREMSHLKGGRAGVGKVRIWMPHEGEDALVLDEDGCAVIVLQPVVYPFLNGYSSAPGRQHKPVENTCPAKSP